MVRPVNRQKPDRRAVLAGALGAAAAPAAAHAITLPREITRHPGYRPWKQAVWPRPIPMNLPVRLPDNREISLGAWLQGGPVVLILWAHWCGPCISEKPAQAFLSRRLAASHSPTRIKMLQAYDDIGPAEGIEDLARYGARGLDVAQASKPLEQAFVKIFGPADRDETRTFLPSELLLGPDGMEIGRNQGTMSGRAGESYWGDVTTFQFLIELGHALG